MAFFVVRDGTREVLRCLLHPAPCRIAVTIIWLQVDGAVEQVQALLGSLIVEQRHGTVIQKVGIEHPIFIGSQRLIVGCKSTFPVSPWRLKSALG